ncbi:hypothetical protein BBK36DRAFT_1190826 [Trichoderma citrinoviride]|uniref:Uncharacterized protein n=1 Tax=Trichoderma citrinoviride TaxID=58853 RepID=A0A2T4BGJ4_9HYPO|nr:hypothetical protein BBK36DRAFT_1190826 [Trichoderma citrinoviride]PTB68444.1 hypothetical protein BBK36DRAFT_1190826 [Trichoderma citrinoviride]
MLLVRPCHLLPSPLPPPIILLTGCKGPAWCYRIPSPMQIVVGCVYMYEVQRSCYQLKMSLDRQESLVQTRPRRDQCSVTANENKMEIKLPTDETDLVYACRFVTSYEGNVGTD